MYIKVQIVQIQVSHKDLVAMAKFWGFFFG